MVEIGVVVEEAEGEEVELGKLMEEVAGTLSEGRAEDILPGVDVVGRGGGTTTSRAGVGGSREEESRREQGSSGCVGSAGSGEGTLWGEAIREVRGKGGEVPK